MLFCPRGIGGVGVRGTDLVWPAEEDEETGVEERDEDEDDASANVSDWLLNGGKSLPWDELHKLAKETFGVVANPSA